MVLVLLGLLTICQSGTQELYYYFPSFIHALIHFAYVFRFDSSFSWYENDGDLLSLHYSTELLFLLSLGHIERLNNLDLGHSTPENVLLR